MVKYLTREGLEKLQKKLERLKAERPEIVKRISHAASHGDLKENAGYHAAREDLAFLDGEMKKLTAVINQAEVADEKKQDSVQIGVVVFLKSKEGNEKYQVVESEEADISAGKISVRSFLGQALLGKKKGEIVKFTTPGGLKEYEILKVE